MKLLSKFRKSDRCEECASWCEKTLVSNPRKLGALISKIKEAERVGVLEHVPPREGSYEEDFKTIDAKGPWTDIVLCQFVCTFCGKKFELFADTYHGGRNNGWHPK